MGWLDSAGGFSGVAALLIALATWYSHRTSKRSSDRSAQLQEKALETTEAETLVAGALSLAKAVQERLAAVEAQLARATERIADLERERDELLELLDAMGAPRTIAQARRRRRSEGAGD